MEVIGHAKDEQSGGVNVSAIAGMQEGLRFQVSSEEAKDLSVGTIIEVHVKDLTDKARILKPVGGTA